MKMVKYCLYLTDEQIANLNAETVRTGVTVSEQIRRALTAQQLKEETQ
jgi:hypothetical protein